jgi:signal transduction histidine kinase
MNLILNSVEALSRRRPADPWIRIEADGKTVRIRDNGGGFEPGILTGLQRREFRSTRTTGSGLGLMLAHSEMARLGGRASFRNEPEGACVELEFPARLLCRPAGA